MLHDQVELAALAATNALVVTTPSGRGLELGVTAASVVACAALVARRRNLLLGLAAAVALAALARAVGIGIG